jgi:hypothetical protein
MEEMCDMTLRGHPLNMTNEYFFWSGSHILTLFLVYLVGSKLWGGRFTGATDPVMEQFNASIGYDKRMWKEDIAGSKAYVQAIQKIGIVSVPLGVAIRQPCKQCSTAGMLPIPTCGVELPI